MNPIPTAHLPPALLLAAALALSACNRDGPSPPAQPAGESGATSGTTDEGFIARTARAAMERARTELAEGNIGVGGTGSGGVKVNGFDFGGENGSTAHLPKAEITPQGDLLIGGTAVAIDAAQRRQLLAYRTQILDIADAGIAVGMQGVELGTRAARGAIASVLSGERDAFEARMEAEGARIEAEAQKICERLPALLASQQALAAALPDFRPYATMDASSIDNCGKEASRGSDAAAEADAAAEPSPD